MAKGTKRPCPKCKSTNVLPIAYGLPGPEMFESAERNEIVLGGCCVSSESPRWYCCDCDHRWPGEPPTEPKSAEDTFLEMMGKWRESK